MWKSAAYPSFHDHWKSAWSCVIAPLVDSRYKTPTEEIQAAVDVATFAEQAVKLRQYLARIDELEKHLAEILEIISSTNTAVLYAK